MVTGVGIDLVEIGRIERALERRRGLADRLFTPGELGYARGRHRPGMHLAARFAAKEAAIKALGGAIGSPLTEIEVVAGEPPVIRLAGAAERAAGGVRLHVSLTHTDSTASAVVVAEA